MSTPLDTDLLLVERNGQSYKQELIDMADILDTDLLLISRNGQSYKITGADYKAAVGPVNDDANLKRDENQSATPAYSSGTGTQADPFVLTSDSANFNGQAFSNQLITIYGCVADLEIDIVDSSTSTNGARFLQPTLTTSAAGAVTFNMEFIDDPGTSGGGSYTGTLNVGNIYWTWSVTVLATGVIRPSITDILGQDGAYHTPITGPSFTGSAAAASELIFIDPADATGLTASTTATGLATTAVTGTGSGLTVDAQTDGSGDIKFLVVNAGGSNYKFGDEVSVNLSAFNGDTATKLTVYTEPVTTSSITFKVNAFSSVNAGNFIKQQWAIGTDPAFSDSTLYSLYDVNQNTLNPTIQTTLGLGAVYYSKVRYQTDTQVYSAWSQTAKAGLIGNLDDFSYVLANHDLNLGSTSYKSFESPQITIDKLAGTYFTHLTQVEGLVESWQSQYGTEGDVENMEAIYIQLRNDLNLTVLNVDGSGGVTSVQVENQPKGLSDYFQGRDVDTTTNGSGSGYKFNVNKINGITSWTAHSNAGSGYAIGDTITFTSPLGNAAVGSVPNVSAINVGHTSLNVSHNTLTMDSDNDIFIHGLGATGGHGSVGSSHNGYQAAGGGGGGRRWDGNGYNGGNGTRGGGTGTGWGGGGGSKDANAFFGTRGAERVNGIDGNRAAACGGAGFNGGNVGSPPPRVNHTSARAGGPGGGGGASCVNALYNASSSTCGSATTYAQDGCYVYLGGSQVAQGSGFFYKLY